MTTHYWHCHIYLYKYDSKNYNWSILSHL